MHFPEEKHTAQEDHASSSHTVCRQELTLTPYMQGKHVITSPVCGNNLYFTFAPLYQYFRRPNSGSSPVGAGRADLHHIHCKPPHSCTSNQHHQAAIQCRKKSCSWRASVNENEWEKVWSLWLWPGHGCWFEYYKTADLLEFFTQNSVKYKNNTQWRTVLLVETPCSWEWSETSGQTGFSWQELK